MFSEVENKDVKVPDFSVPEPYTPSKNLAHMYRFVPIKDKDILSFVWFLPYTQPEYKT